VFVPHTDKYYEAKVLKSEYRGQGGWYYFLHYNGWNKKYDEWVEAVGLVKGDQAAAVGALVRALLIIMVHEHTHIHKHTHTHTHHIHMHIHSYRELARTKYICIYQVFGRETTKCTVVCHIRCILTVLANPTRTCTPKCAHTLTHPRTCILSSPPPQNTHTLTHTIYTHTHLDMHRKTSTNFEARHGFKDAHARTCASVRTHIHTHTYTYTHHTHHTHTHAHTHTHIHTPTLIHTYTHTKSHTH